MQPDYVLLQDEHTIAKMRQPSNTRYKKVQLRIVATLVLVPIFCTSQQVAASPVNIKEAPVEIHSQRIVAEHRTTDLQVIRSPLEPKKSFYDQVTVQIVTRKDGTVASAVATDGPNELWPEAVSYAKTLIYRSFLHDDQPVEAKFDETIYFVPLVPTPRKPTPFPKIQDWKSLSMTLQRTGCLGTCPAYKLEVKADGSVLYDGMYGVAVLGQHKSKISKAQVKKLVEEFRQADFFANVPATQVFSEDAPKCYMGISFDGKSTLVEDTVPWLPKGVDLEVDLEQSFEIIADSEKWLFGNQKTIPSLQAEHWDFQRPSKENADLISAITKFSAADVLQDLVSTGISTTGEALRIAAKEEEPEKLRILLNAGRFNGEQLGNALLEAAAAGSEENAMILLEHGANPNQKDGDGNTLLMRAVDSGNEELVRELIKGGADVNARNKDGETPLMAPGDTDIYNDHVPEEELTRVAQLLIEMGANVNAVDNKGDTVLMVDANDPGIIALLLKHRVDVNARNVNGETALMSCYDIAAARELLNAGADPYVVNLAGKTALEVNDYKPVVELIKEWMRQRPR